MVQMLADQKKLQKSLDKINAWVKKVEEGDIEVIEEYKRARVRLEETENEEL